jgi:hypothetical protein
MEMKHYSRQDREPNQNLSKPGSSMEEIHKRQTPKKSRVDTAGTALGPLFGHRVLAFENCAVGRALVAPE